MTNAGDMLLAHSARPGEQPDPYERHVQAVRVGAQERATAMLYYAQKSMDGFLETLDAAATFHDLGKLDEENQAALRDGRRQRLPWDHIDAGVAHLLDMGFIMGAWLNRAHHAPGLPRNSNHFNKDNIGRRLRGRRNDDVRINDSDSHREQKKRTDAHLSKYLADHSLVLNTSHAKKFAKHGMTMRLALSCLVDADHADTAYFDTGTLPSISLEPRWEDRLQSLLAYIGKLPKGESEDEQLRNSRRRAFFDACLNSEITAPMVACEGPVGLGKTTAVVAYLLQRAIRDKLRRIIIVAPFTNILSQTAERLRAALVLPHENADQVIVEHHHQADFSNFESRQLAVLWNAPIVLTTAVSFFETLSACHPGTLRKFHSVPGSGIILDESHAVLPVRLWRQNYSWLRELATDWSCPILYASGSLVKFWEEKCEIVVEPTELPELLPPKQARDVLEAERHRISYKQLANGKVVNVSELINLIAASPGPRLVIMNTVQNAAIIASEMHESGGDILHLSTALTPKDRNNILIRVKSRLRNQSLHDWTLVATSCVEAGVDLSFQTAFRERFSASSLIQTGGRVNRNSEYGSSSNIYDFAIGDPRCNSHPEAKYSAGILLDFMKCNLLNESSPSEVVTCAMQTELRHLGIDHQHDPLSKAEREKNYPEVEELGKVIKSETAVVVVDKSLQIRLQKREKISFREILEGSVQLWMYRISDLGLERLSPNSEIYIWNDEYDSKFLGYMEPILNLDKFKSSGCAII